MGRSPDLSRLVMFGRKPGTGRPGAATAGDRGAARASAGPDGHGAAGIAVTESMATGQDARDTDRAVPVDARLIKESFSYVMASPQHSMEYFFAHLFTRNPEIRALFPLEMSALRGRVFNGLARLVWTMDEPETCAAFLAQIARDHRKFGVRDRHLQSFFSALADTAERAAGPAWTPDMAAAWQGVLHNAVLTMRTAMRQDAQVHPAWWLAEIVRHDLRTESLAVLTLRPDQPLPYQPGQFIDLQVPRWPRLWRSYSPANAPRADGTIDLHVRAVGGGMVSTALVHHVGPGESLLLGPARGTMTAEALTPVMPSAQSRPGLLCIAGGTGLAPIKALIEGLLASGRVGDRARPGSPAGPSLAPAITLLCCARSEDELYDLPALAALAAARPGLTVVPAVIGRPGTLEPGRSLPDLLASQQISPASEVFISGPPGMVAAACQALEGRVPGGRIHHDPLDGLPVPAPFR